MEKQMNALKQATIETIKRLPDECTLDDIMYQINFVAQVLEGLEDADAGRVVSTEELLEKIGKWSKNNYAIPLQREKAVPGALAKLIIRSAPEGKSSGAFS